MILDSDEKKTFKETIQCIDREIPSCVENWQSSWGKRKAIEVHSGIDDIDLLFSMAEIVNLPIQNHVAEWVKAVFPSDQSVFVVQGPVKRPSRAIAYVYAFTHSALFVNFQTILRSKVYRVYRGDVSKLTDVVRCQVAFPNLYKMKHFMNHLLNLHRQSSIEILRVRNRLDDDYDAVALTGGYRDCNVKIRLAFDLHKTDGSVMFMDVSRPKVDYGDQVEKICFGLIRLGTESDKNEPEETDKSASRLHFICELQLILKVRCELFLLAFFCSRVLLYDVTHSTLQHQDCADCLKEDSKAYKRYVKRRDSLAA